MFTGIIEEIGNIIGLSKKGGSIRFHVTAPKSIKELRVNDSVAINGTCQTVIFKRGNSFEVEAVEETLSKTTLGFLKTGDKVNIELPMKLNERLGGHLVLGHVDCVGKIMKIDKRESSWMVTVKFPEQFSRYTIPVGSIAIDGVSLTVAKLKENNIQLSIIHHTMDNTIFKYRKVNDNVNIEFDIIGKYIERISDLNTKPKVGISERKLREAGY